MAVSKTWVLSLKLFLISTSLVSISMLIKISVPLATQFICHQIPIIWSCLASLLRPPYLYFVVNGIIIVIAVSSRYHNVADERNESDQSVPRSDHRVLAYHEAAESSEAVGFPDEEVVKSMVVSTWAQPQRSKSFERLPEKPLVSTTYAGDKDPKTTSQGGRASSVTKPSHNDSLENTWKSITRTALHKKPETWENQDHPSVKVNPSPPAVKKSATFRDRTNYEPAVKSSPSPRKDPLLGQDELNRRVEAFIRKFNDEMRLQRQESLNKYVNMIKSARG